jgi:hypothetical protein
VRKFVAHSEQMERAVNLASCVGLTSRNNNEMWTFLLVVRSPTMRDLVISLCSGARKAFVTGARIQDFVQRLRTTFLRGLSGRAHSKTVEPEKQPLLCNDCERCGEVTAL